MKPSGFEQGSDGWHAQRKGKLTASNFGAAAGLNPYMSRQELWRVMTGRAEPFTGNIYTEYGTKHEPFALRDYQIYTGNSVLQSGFVQHPALVHLGASPDGLVSSDGSVECKCKHDGSMFQEIPTYYLAQIFGVMECTGRDWCDFVSWAPGFGKWSPININIIPVQYIKNEWELLLELLDAFWTCVLHDTEPKKLSKRPTWGQ